MSSSRRHRGPHPQDDALFGPDQVGKLRDAVEDLSWLRTRGYAEPSSVKLVGDRYQLRARQRVAVARCACPDTAMASREARRLGVGDAKGRSVAIDGLNVLTTIEVALAGGVLLLGRDGCVRDMASFHGNYRLVHETERAVDLLLQGLERLGVSNATVYIDRPVSNSGRLAAVIRSAADASGLDVEAILSDRVDAELKSTADIVATADSAILDASGPWFNLARHVVSTAPMPRRWLLDLA